MLFRSSQGHLAIPSFCSFADGWACPDPRAGGTRSAYELCLRSLRRNSPRETLGISSTQRRAVLPLTVSFFPFCAYVSYNDLCTHAREQARSDPPCAPLLLSVTPLLMLLYRLGDLCNGILMLKEGPDEAYSSRPQ